MKLVALICIMISASALSCPDISGSYKLCSNSFESSKRTFTVDVKQKKEGKSYQITWEVVKGNPDLYVANCEKNRLISSNSDGMTSIEVKNGKLLHKYYHSGDTSKQPTVIACVLDKK